MLKFNRQQAEDIFSGLIKGYRVIAPINIRGRGRFSNTDLLTYADAQSFSEINFAQKTHYSAKSVFLPVRQVMFKLTKSAQNEPREQVRPAIVFLRACDINATLILDQHFLENGNFKDNYYQKQRAALKFFLMECAQPFDNCFCASMGTNTTKDYSVFIRKVDDSYEVEIKDEEFIAIFSQAKETLSEPKFVPDTQAISIPEDIDCSIFEHELWKEYAQRCIACGRCNISCPTCSCFSVDDIPSEDQAGAFERTRVWSSCQIKNFALLAGNHDFRVDKGQRMRYKVLHKIRDFKKRTGKQMCVGCGRCDDVCPEYISMFKCVEKINEAMTYATARERKS